MARNSETYDETTIPVDYVSGEFTAGERVQGSVSLRGARVRSPDGYVAVPRWCFVSLLGMSIVGAVFSVLLVAAILAAG